jgi:hypothetical protein
MRRARTPRGLPDEEPFRVLVGQRVRDLRLARGLSQRGLAERLGFSPSRLSKYESGAVRGPRRRAGPGAPRKGLPVHAARATKPSGGVSAAPGTLDGSRVERLGGRLQARPVPADGRRRRGCGETRI